MRSRAAEPPRRRPRPLIGIINNVCNKNLSIFALSPDKQLFNNRIYPMKKAILIALLLATLTVTAAVHTELKFKQIGLSQGLSHATVAAIGQDADGYMWIATPDGLNRYDGYSFRVYRPEPGNESSLADNSVKRLAFDAEGAMWVCGNRTLSRYDASADNFANYPFDGQGSITDILPIDSERVLVGSTAGLYTFNPASGKFAEGASGKKVSKQIASLSRQGDFVYIAAGKEGLSRLNLADGTLAEIPLEGGPSVAQTLPDGKSLLVATEGHGLFRLDPATGRTTSYRAGGHEGLGSDYVRSLAHDNQGRVWIGTFNGLDILDAERKHFTHYGAGSREADNLSHASVRRIYADHQGGMWLGTYFGGLNYYHPLKNQFHTLRHSPLRPSLNDNVIGAMTEDADRNLWIATNNGGLNLYNPTNDSYRHFTKADGLGSNDVKAIYIDDKAGKIYIGSHLGGLNILDKRSGRISTPPNLPSNIYAIAPALRDGHLWFATIDRLVLYNMERGTTASVPTNGLKRMTDLYRDSRGLLWVSGEDGVTAFSEDADARLEPATSVPAEINNYRRGVNNVYLSRDGRNYYISTNDGLIRYDSANDSVSRFTTAQGMPNNIVYGVLEDANGNLWCSTNRGLAFLNPATGAIRAYSERDGLQSNQFNRKSFLRSSAGYLYFGGINGLTYFNPTVLESNPYAPAPVITGLRLFNNPVVPGDESGLLERSVAETEKVTFGADQTVFTIDFTVCNYVAGNHNTFSYKLEGLEDQWTTIDGPGSVTYSNLPAGNYRFLLKAANNDGVWCEETTGLDITILPKWYDRWWARTLLALMIIGGIALIMAYFYRRKARRERERLAALDSERQRELNEMKVRFFINMSHELRTPLTLILLPIQELLQRATDRKTAQKLSIVKNNAERILRIVNQLLDYRRAEMGMFKLKAEPVLANDLLRKIFANYEYQATRRGIDYTFDSTMPDTPVLCDPQYIDLICNNLISNAFKYTPKGQSINVALAKGGTPDKPTMRLTVKDTGCGIPAEKLPEIFTRFYKVYDRAGGSGIGLSLVKRLVELHHGTINVESELGVGTTFTVELPVGPSEYSADERASESSAAPTTALPAPLDIPDMTELPDETDSAEAPADAPGSDSDKERETVLVVDDNPDILKYICESLAETYNVVPAADGAKAIQILSGQKVDLIITDIMMPDIDGVQLCRTVKRNLRTSHIPVIMLSAKNDVADQLGGFRVGADDYIAKPFSMEVLASKIRNQLRTRRQAIRHFSDSADIKPETSALNPLDEEFLKKAMATMEKHLDDSEFSTDAFASEMCMSRSNLHLKMKALTGESTNEFIRRFRLRKAMELLKTGRYNISQVSAMVGYGTPSYFATSFKKFYGELPSAFLKND